MKRSFKIRCGFIISALIVLLIINQPGYMEGITFLNIKLFLLSFFLLMIGLLFPFNDKN